MASFLQLRSPGCWRECLVDKFWKRGIAWRLTWCISTVTVPPAFTGHFPATARAPVLQTKSLAPTLVKGEFEPGMRTHEEPCWECQSGDGVLTTKESTYIISAVHPELLEDGVPGYFPGSEGCQRGGECGPHRDGRMDGRVEGLSGSTEQNWPGKGGHATKRVLRSLPV